MILSELVDSYPSARFNYSNYGVDPRPHVLILGDWRHPSSGNDLKAGVNLNYLSREQLDRLRGLLGKLFARGNLRARYRFLRSVAPDIARYYRTYDTDYIRGFEPEELDGYEAGVRAVGADRGTRGVRRKHSGDLARPGKELERDLVDTGRELWGLKRQLYDPETGRRNKPERGKVSGVGKREKLARYRQQRRKLRELERELELGRLASRVGGGPKQSELGGDVYESFVRHPVLGVIWGSPGAYRDHHRVGSVIVPSGRGGRVLGVVDCDSGEVLVDNVSCHDEIIVEAGWENRAVGRISACGSSLLVESDFDVPAGFDGALVLEEIMSLSMRR